MTREQYVGIFILALLVLGIAVGLYIAHSGWMAVALKEFRGIFVSGEAELVENFTLDVSNVSTIVARVEGGYLEVSHGVKAAVRVYRVVSWFPRTSDGHYAVKVVNGTLLLIDVSGYNVRMSLPPISLSKIEISVSGGGLLWDVATEALEASVDVSGGYAEVKDLRSGSARLLVSGGYAKLEASLTNVGEGSVKLDVSGGVAFLTLRTPKGSGLEVKQSISGGAIAIEVDGREFTGYGGFSEGPLRIEGSPTYRLTLHVSGGYASIVVERTE